jgi:hypothetical protein
MNLRITFGLVHISISVDFWRLPPLIWQGNEKLIVDFATVLGVDRMTERVTCCQTLLSNVN